MLCWFVGKLVGGINENMRNSAALSQAEVTLKLNKKQNQPIWAFDIKGYTVSRSHLVTTAPIARLTLGSTGIEKINDHNPRDQCQNPFIQATRGSQRASLSSPRRKSFSFIRLLTFIFINWLFERVDTRRFTKSARIEKHRFTTRTGSRWCGRVRESRMFRFPDLAVAFTLIKPLDPGDFVVKWSMLIVFPCVGAIGRYDGISSKVVKSQSHNDVEGSSDTSHEPYVSPSPSPPPPLSLSHISPKHPYIDNTHWSSRRRGRRGRTATSTGTNDDNYCHY